MIRKMEHFSQEEMLRELGLSKKEKALLRGPSSVYKRNLQKN